MKDKGNIIKRIKSKIYELIYMLCHEEIQEDDKERHKNMMIFCACIAIVTFITSFMNILMKAWVMAITTSILWSSAFIFMILLYKNKNVLRCSMLFYVYTFAIIFTYYFMIGGNDGFAALWIILLPFFIYLVGGSRQSFFVSIYFQLLLILFCWTPLKNLLMYTYSTEFLKRFPILYFFCLISAITLMYKMRVYEIEQAYAMKTLNKAVLDEKIRNQKLSFQTLISMSTALDAKDVYTKYHSERVAEISKQIALQMGWTERRAEILYQAGMVHDIGKIGVEDNILKKNSRLTDEEYDLIKKHPSIGWNIIRPSIENRLILNVVLYHHERFDGKGYPEGLKGENIPIEARIVSVADTFDAMNSNRVYRTKCNHEYIRNELINGKEKQFDAIIVDAFLKIIDAFW